MASWRKRFNLSAAQQTEHGFGSRGGIFSGSWLGVRFLSQAEPVMLGEFQKIMDLADMKATG